MQPTISGRRPPCNLDAERAVLGAALLDREAVGLAREVIEGRTSTAWSTG